LAKQALLAELQMEKSKTEAAEYYVNFVIIGFGCVVFGLCVLSTCAYVFRLLACPAVSPKQQAPAGSESEMINIDAKYRPLPTTLLVFGSIVITTFHIYIQKADLSTTEQHFNDAFLLVGNDYKLKMEMIRV